MRDEAFPRENERRGGDDAAPILNKDGFFDPAKGSAVDTCPLCGIFRKYAGNPAACGKENFGQPGCFAAKGES